MIVVSTLLNAAYYVPIVYAAFFKPPPDDSNPHGEAPLPMLLALSATAAGSVALFFFSQLPLQLAKDLVGN